MATIEERAKEYMHGDIESPVRLAMHDAYIDGAKDQRNEDFTKVCHALEMVVSKNVLEELKKIFEE